MILVNLYGAPGSGKSTGAAYIFSQLKMAGINAELVTEFAKDKVWEESKEVFNNQAYIFGKQYFRISRCMDKVDVIVTDSPLALSAFYNNSEILGEEFTNVVMKVANSFNSKNYFIKRVKPYNPKGRFQTENEAKQVDSNLETFLRNNNINYEIEQGNLDGYNNIVRQILNIFDF